MYKDKFSEIKIGDEAQVFHVITAEDVEKFIELTGDNNCVHVDDHYAAGTILKKRIVHGMLTASFISTLIGTKLPGHGALWYEQHTCFVRPVYIGENVRVWAKVKRKSDAMRVIVLDVIVFNSKELEVVKSEAKVKVVQRIKTKEGEDVYEEFRIPRDV